MCTIRIAGNQNIFRQIKFTFQVDIVNFHIKLFNFDISYSYIASNFNWFQDLHAIIYRDRKYLEERTDEYLV